MQLDVAALAAFSQVIGGRDFVGPDLALAFLSLLMTYLLVAIPDDFDIGPLLASPTRKGPLSGSKRASGGQMGPAPGGLGVAPFSASTTRHCPAPQLHEK